MARALGIVGVAYYSVEKDAEAAPLLREAIRIDRKAEEKDSENSWTLVFYLAKSDLRLGQVVEAEALALDSLEKMERLIGQPRPSEEPDLVADITAKVAARSGHREQIERRLRQFVTAVEKRAGIDTPAAALAYYVVAQTYSNLESFDQARQFALRAWRSSGSSRATATSRWPTPCSAWDTRQGCRGDTPKLSRICWNV